MGKDVKSLKKFFTTDSVDKEVATWDADDCFKYLNKHAEDESKWYSILKKKLRIVFKHYCKKFKKVSSDSNYTKQLNKILDLVKKNFGVDEVNESILENVKLLSLIMNNSDSKKIIDSEEVLESIVTNKKYNDYLLNDINLLKAVLQNENTMKTLIAKSELFLKILNNVEAQKLVEENIDYLKEMVKYKNLTFFIISSDMFDYILTNYKKVLDEDVDFRNNLLCNAYTSPKLRGYLDYDNCLDLPDEWIGADICLWLKGYTVEKFINNGGFGAFFACKDSSGKEVGLKVTNLNNGGTIGEINLVSELNNQLEERDTDNDATKKMKKRARKYTVVPTKIKGSNNILEAPLAKGDLKVRKRKYRTFDSVIKDARQALKGVKYLHDLGYSHNDIKSQNFLTIDKSKIPDEAPGETFELTKEQRKDLKSELDRVKYYDLEGLKNLIRKYAPKAPLDKIMDNIDKKIKSNKVTAGGENDDKLIQEERITRLKRYIQNNIISNTRVVVTDFGSLTKIPKEGEKGTYARIVSSWYFPECEMGLRGKLVEREQIVKRDVYALGVTFYQLLVQQVCDLSFWRSTGGADVSTVKQFDEYYKRDQQFWQLIYSAYGNQTIERIAKFVLLINKMIKPNYKERITIEEAYKEIKSI